MVRTKHVYVFLLTLLLVCLLGAAYLVYTTDISDDSNLTLRDAVFVEEESNFGVSVLGPEKDTSVRNSLLRKLQGWVSEEPEPDIPSFEESDFSDTQTYVSTSSSGTSVTEEQGSGTGSVSTEVNTDVMATSTDHTDSNASSTIILNPPDNRMETGTTSTSTD